MILVSLSVAHRRAYLRFAPPGLLPHLSGGHQSSPLDSPTVGSACMRQRQGVEREPIGFPLEGRKGQRKPELDSAWRWRLNHTR